MTRPISPSGPHRFTFPSGARPLDGYTIKRAVGRGGFGEVYYATSDAGKEVALKLVLRNLDVERRGVTQCMNLKSPHLITIYDLKTDDAGDNWVVMEYVSGPSLASVLSRYPDGMPLNEVRAWLKGLVAGVEYLHDHGIVHRDLKPANLFMEEGVVKIGDYGLSKSITQSQDQGHTESIGTCHYMAPEIASGKYHKPIDIYALGVILYQMLTGRLPFDGESPHEIMMKHLTARPDLSPLPEPYRALVGRALAKDPDGRPTRASDLLGPEDAPREPAVRFIGEGKVTPPTPEPTRPQEDNVLRIGAEEPVFYIGPNTWPTREQTGQSGWFPFRPRNAPPRRPARPQPPRRLAAATPAPSPRPVPQPVPLPSGRIRVAELATSMLLATPLVAFLAALTVPVGSMLGLNLPHQAEQIAYLFGLTLLGVWGVLIPAKLWEGRTVEPMTRRLVLTGVGSALGAAGLAFADWTRLNLGTHGGPFGEMPQVEFRHIEWLGPYAHTNLPVYLVMALFFGLAFGANGWWKLTARDRKARFRVLPVVRAGLSAGVLALILAAAYPSLAIQPWIMLVVLLVAIAAQVVSPWNRAAAAYARYVRLNGSRVA